MKHSQTRMMFGVALLLISSTGLFANVTYTYTGNDFTSVGGFHHLYTTSDSVTGYFTVAAPLPANWNGYVTTFFNFSDGVQTITPANATNPTTGIGLLTNSAGQIIAWDINIGSTANGADVIHAESSGTGLDYGQVYVGGFANDYGENFGPPGTWTASAVPEPTSFGLMLTGFGLAAGALRHRLKL